MRTVIDRVLEVARRHMGIETLESRNSDSLDFHDLSVGTIRNGLCEAFVQGQRSIVDIIDWDELRTQKQWLLTQATSTGSESAYGLINLLDWIQDQAVASGIDSERVFDFGQD
jgi:hypothetical protein